MLIKFMEQLNVKIIKFLFRMKIVNMEYGKWLILKKLIIKALIKQENTYIKFYFIERENKFI